MRLATQIIRTPFGASNAELATRHYDGSSWVTLRDQQDVLHRKTVAAAVADAPGPVLGVTSGYREHHGHDADGRIAEWWSVITYDGPADESCA